VALSVTNTFLDSDDLINTAVFKVANTANFLWKNLDDAHIIYDIRSGHSQALNDFAREIFAIIEESPCQLSDIIDELQTILERPLEPELLQQVRQTVIEFDRMGLIEPQDPQHEE